MMLHFTQNFAQISNVISTEIAQEENNEIKNKNNNNNHYKKRPENIVINHSTVRRNSEPSSSPSTPKLKVIVENEKGESWEETMENAANRRHSMIVVDDKNSSDIELKEELLEARCELEKRITANNELLENQERMNGEITELTASLFEEANKMVQDANLKRIQTEKELNSANNKIEMLQAEVAALKALVITSTPATPNKHLHPQLDMVNGSSPFSPIVNKPVSNKFIKKSDNSNFVKTHRRSTSHHHFTPDEISNFNIDAIAASNSVKELPPKSDWNVDRILFDEFNQWKENTNKSENTNAVFLKRIINEDISPCLNFPNELLAKDIHQAIKTNRLTMEPTPAKESLPRLCSLTQRTNNCPYRVRLNDIDEWHYISLLARNRIASIADFYTYLRYIILGLVKCRDTEIFEQIMNIRKKMAMSRLGYNI